MSKSDPEYKNFKESYDRVVPYFQERLQHVPEEVVQEVFLEISNRQPEFVNVLTRSMLDLCDLIRFFARCFRKVNPVAQPTGAEKRNTFALMVEILSQIGNKLLNSDPLQTEVFFLEYGADELLDVMTDN